MLNLENIKEPEVMSIGETDEYSTAQIVFLLMHLFEKSKFTTYPIIIKTP